MNRIVEKVNFPIPKQPKAKRVAAYARVSSGKNEMLHSLSAQISYYSELIQSYPGWLYCGVFSDALAGEIDLIITKSVSRFARNTVDRLVIIRKLKDKGVEVYFEKENIWTFDSKGELLLTIMSSLAQEESRSISENVTWGQRKRFSDGKVSLPYKHFLGYELEQKKENKLSKRKAIDRFISNLSKRDELLTEFDNCLWLTVADKVTVRKDGTLVFKFNDGTEIKG